MILRAGLTGGIASGKSTIAKTFARLGAHVIDADAVVAKLYRPGQPGFAAIVEHYGEQILRADGEIDRARLSGIALATPESAAKLNAIIHPLVIAEEAKMIEEEGGGSNVDRVAIVEAALLLESGGRDRYGQIIVVDLDRETQLERAVARGMERKEAQRRIDRQMSREDRLRLADYVIDNSGTPEDAELQTREVYSKLQAALLS